MESETTHEGKDTTISQALYMAMELRDMEWKLGFTIGFGQSPRLRNVAARNLAGLVKGIRLAKERFSLPEKTLVLSCYEAGRDGFWLHRYLQTQGVTNLVWIQRASK